MDEYALKHMREHYRRFIDEGEYTKADMLYFHIENCILWNLPIFGWFYRRISCWIDGWVENDEDSKFSRWWK